MYLDGVVAGANFMSAIVESARELRAKFVKGIEDQEAVWDKVQRTTYTNPYYLLLVHICTGTIMGS